MRFSKYFLTLFILFLLHLQATKAQTSQKIKGQLQAISEDNIFLSEDYFNWGGSILKGEDGMYHLFYSRWPKSKNKKL